MKKVNKNRKLRIALIVFVCGLLIALVSALFLRKERQTLLSTGEETIGVVTNTYTIGSRFGTGPNPYIIEFSFFMDDTIIDGACSLSYEEKEQFQKAVVGDTYKVRFSPEEPYKKVRIYIDEPVTTSEKEYKRLWERLWIKRKD